MDYCRALPEGRQLWVKRLGIDGDFEDVHEGSVFTSAYEECFKAPKAGSRILLIDGKRIPEPADITYTSYQDYITDTLPQRHVDTVIYHDGRFVPLEWHLTREGGHDIPPNKQVKHYIH